MKNEAEVTKYVAATFPGVAAISAPGGSFFYYDPNGNIAADHRLPFATVVISDDYDKASQLHRPDVFRLNMGVTKETFRKLFGDPPTKTGADGIVETGHDFTALDVLMPHPVYATQSWVSVLNPAETTLEDTKKLLAEAYENAVRKFNKREKL